MHNSSLFRILQYLGIISILRIYEINDAIRNKALIVSKLTYPSEMKIPYKRWITYFRESGAKSELDHNNKNDHDHNIMVDSNVTNSGCSSSTSVTLLSPITTLSE